MSHYIKGRSWQTVVLLVLLSLALTIAVVHWTANVAAQATADADTGDGATAENGSQDANYSHRLIVQLESPSLAAYAQETGVARLANGRLDLNSAAAQNYIATLEAEQAAFVREMAKALPDAAVAAYLNEAGQSIEATYQITFNGVAVDPGKTDTDVAQRQLAKLPGVKAVFRDFKHYPDLYASLPLINAPAAWDLAGGRADAGSGVKVASMDGGLHHDAPMFANPGGVFTYPVGFQPDGLGDPANNNGKIIASRAYFRPFDPPAPGDENTWPGENGTPHGVHTGSTAAGNVVTATYAGTNIGQISGVAPGAWVMSYRMFYASVLNDGSFHTVEGIAALEDIVADGADVVNNSWGGGPGSAGGEFDPLDTALINAANAGVFVSMAAGNSGPDNGTTDHPSDEYINVAASTTDGAYALGRLSVSAPEPVSDTLEDMNIGSALFGPPLPVGEVITHTFTSAASVEPGNVTGCSPFTGTPFDGKAALISRGDCFFGNKVYHAQQAGAEFVVVYNNAGDSVLNMSFGCDYAPDCDASDITISSVFIGQTNGEDMVDWHATHGDASELELSTVAFQAGNTPDQIIGFSSRGPGVGNVLKPDIAAPGVNIMAQGYDPTATGEARHLGFGQVSGTSMASPHVAGSATVLREVRPTWSNAAIKSALMSTAKYTDVYNFDGSPAQPLDMGAGRLDLTYAADPGVILDPPSLSFGQMVSGTSKTINVMVTSVATETETYDLSTLYTGNGFAITQTTALTGFTVMPAQITLAPSAAETISVTFDSAAGMGIGDNQGYIVMDGNNGHHAHMPAWARVTPAPDGADVLVIDNDFSPLLGFPHYLSYYTDALDDLGMTYDVWDADLHFANPATIPDAATLSKYKAVIYFTGDNFYPDGTFTVQTPLTALDMNRLTEFANQGGIVIAMGQDISSVLVDSFFDDFVLGDEQLQDSVTNSSLPSLPIGPMPDAPAALQEVALDLSGPDTYVGTVEMPDFSTEEFNTVYMPLIANGTGPYTPLPEPPTGLAMYSYDASSNRLDYNIVVSATVPVTVTAAHIHEGSILETGPVLYPLFSGPTYVTDTLAIEGSLLVDPAHVSALLNEALYVNVHTTVRPAGAVRGQVALSPANDGANNQSSIDEMATDPTSDTVPEGIPNPYTPLFRYPGASNIQDGVVAMAHRDQPTLERPGISYFGRSIYTSFGLEGVNDTAGMTTRAELLDALFNWAMDEPTVVISDVTSTYDGTTLYTILEATVTSNITGTTGVSYRWDFGDGSDFVGPVTSNMASHQYAACGDHTVRVEATDSWGNVTIGEEEITVTQCP